MTWGSHLQPRQWAVLTPPESSRAGAVHHHCRCQPHGQSDPVLPSYFLHLYLKSLVLVEKTILFQHLEISLLSGDHTTLTANSGAQILWMVEEPQMSGYNVHWSKDVCLFFLLPPVSFTFKHTEHS